MITIKLFRTCKAAEALGSTQKGVLLTADSGSQSVGGTLMPLLE